MHRSLLIWICLLPSIFLLTEAATNRSQEATYKLVYENIYGYVGCFRRFNGTHEIGCATGMNGNVGVIHYINSTESLRWLVNNGTHKPYIPLITSSMFTGSDIKDLLKVKDLVNGIMVVHTNTEDEEGYPNRGFSSDLKCPNDHFSIYRNDKQYSCAAKQFNPTGTGLLFKNLKIPVMVLKSQPEVDKILKCFESFNLPTEEHPKPTFPLCSAELKAFMNGAGNTEICWRRNNMPRNISPDQYCQQLGGRSAHAFLYETVSPTDRARTIVVAARIDSFSMFENTQPGASTPVAAMASLLATAEILRNYRTQIMNSGYNVLFLALTGESFDYIGSQKLIYDMKLDFFPNKTTNSTRMSLSDIHMIVELSQFIRGIDDNTVYIHTDPKTKHNYPEIAQFVQRLNATGVTLKVEAASANQPLPPSSSHMFLRESKNGMPVLVLADYDSRFKTRYYNSYLDTPEAQGFYKNRSSIDNQTVTDQAVFLAKVSRMLSSAIISYTTNTSISNLNDSSSNITTNNVLYCFLINPQCELFYTVVPPANSDVIDKTTNPFPFYVSVYQNSINHVQFLMLQLLAYFTGDAVDLEKDDCQNDTLNPWSTIWMNGPLVNGNRTPICVKTTAQYHNATSPAFEIEDYDFKSGKYSTWTESVWPINDPFHIKIFLRPSTEIELTSMVAGITVFIAAAISTILVHKRVSILFPPHDGNKELVTQPVDST